MSTTPWWDEQRDAGWCPHLSLPPLHPLCPSASPAASSSLDPSLPPLPLAPSLPPNTSSKFISDHGGHTNAYTSAEDTNYQFDVNHEHLETALDRFSQVEFIGLK